MNFLELILKGYLENRNYLKEYFLREQKKAEKEFFGAEEFFGKCDEVIQSFYEEMNKENV